MLQHFRYTDTELKNLLQTLTIIIDSREQDTKHITSYLDKRKIPHTVKKLDAGDYSCMLPANPLMGIMRDIYFPVAIERKNSLEELSANLSQERHRFESELLRARDIDLTLMVEGGSYEMIAQHRYDTQLNEKSFLATLFAFRHRYKVNVQFVQKNFAGPFIYYHMLYFAREELKN